LENEERKKNMGVIAKLVAAPFRLIDLPNKIMRRVVDDKDKEPTVLDKVADAVEDQIKKIGE
jgi:hypothetical protein